MQRSLASILADSAHAGLGIQREDGSFPQGHNGLWNNEETPVRTTANWALAFLSLMGRDEEAIFGDAAVRALDFLLESRFRTTGRPFWCRMGKDPPNGLIGQAWAIDALLEGHDKLGERRYLEAAEDVLLLHGFDDQLGLWYNANMDRSANGINYTLNQQIWFAAVALKASRVGGGGIHRARAESFFRKLPEHIRFDGKRIAHHIKLITEILHPDRTDGYLSFLLFGLARAYKEDAAVVGKITDLVPRCLEYLDGRLFRGNPKYAWTYNPTGFEVAQVIEAFGLKSSIGPERWAEEQLKRTYDSGSALMIRGTQDPNVLSSRICEACGLPEYIFDI